MKKRIQRLLLKDIDGIIEVVLFILIGWDIFKTKMKLTEAAYHTEKIKCPKCGKKQTAKVFHTIPCYTYIHECECGYVIMESEWEPIKPD
jgi:hypothetical protein